MLLFQNLMSSHLCLPFDLSGSKCLLIFCNLYSIITNRPLLSSRQLLHLHTSSFLRTSFHVPPPSYFARSSHISLICSLLLVLTISFSSKFPSPSSVLSATSIPHFSKGHEWKDHANRSRDAYGCRLDPLRSLMVIRPVPSLTKLKGRYCAHQIAKIFFRNFSVNFFIIFLIIDRVH